MYVYLWRNAVSGATEMSGSGDAMRCDWGSLSLSLSFFLPRSFLALRGPWDGERGVHMSGRFDIRY